MVLKNNRQKRHRYEEFYIEGVRVINSALAHHWEIIAFYYPAKKKLSDWARQILKDSAAQFHYEVSEDLMQKISDKEETSELVATVRIPPNDLSRLRVRSDGLVVILDRPNSPGNLGTSVRSCDVFGVDGIIITGHAADVYHPQAVRGSVGSLFAQTVVKVEEQAKLREWISGLKKEAGAVQIIGTSARAATTLDQIKINGLTVLIVGNESFGMSAGYAAMCDTIVKIPQYGWASSLNVSCALSIMLYELSRQRNT
jgi:TrmH family RNA methyltransferase